MTMRNGKIWVKLLIGFIILLIIGTVAGYFVVRAVKGKVKNVVADKLAQLLEPAKKQFLAMLPADYDRDKAQKTFDSFFDAIRQGKVREGVIGSDLMPYLQQSVQDKTLSKEEADSVLKLMNSAILP